MRIRDEELRRLHQEHTRSADRSACPAPERLAARQDHFMPPALLDSQFAALEPPGPDERPIRVSINATPREIVDEVVRRLGEGA